MGEMQVGVATIDDKGLYGLMEDKPVASLNPSLQVSVSFGRFENDILSWEKFSAFSPNKYLEEVGKFATPGSVAQKKAYFEAHYKKIAEKKAEIIDHEKQMDKNASFRSVVTNQGSMEGEIDEECNGQFTCEEDKHVTDIASEVKEVNEETIIVKECQSSVDQVKEEVDNSLDSPKLEIVEEVALMEEKPEEVLQIGEKDVSNETPVKEMETEKNSKLTKKDVNARINRTRNSPKVRTKPTTNKIVTSKKSPPSKEIKNMMKPTKKPAPPISKPSPGLSTPRVYKPVSKTTSLSTSQSSVKKENVSSSLLGNKQTAPRSLHMSMSLGPSASDPTSTRRSLIMERMGDKDIVKRAFRTFQKSYDFTSSVDKQKPALKQNLAKATSVPSVATRQKENGRPTKSSHLEKRSDSSASRSSSFGFKSNNTSENNQKELSKSGARPVEKTRLLKNSKAGVIDAKTRRDSLKPKAKPMQVSLPVRSLPKGSSEKVL
ncbi:protein WVD2-like 7 isoform X2 [Brassica rapa]|uniref:TPX2 C-terminal domain-containing protein n=1 Tax=Brassica campestris TaxID=3711 RepID=M4DIJ1_BRACM|nr:protein WVD2-like 7 isoform X2 [Brassica rapa]